MTLIGNDIDHEKEKKIMALMTGEEYVESMRKMNLNIYMFGEKIENPIDHPILRPSLILLRLHMIWLSCRNMRT